MKKVVLIVLLAILLVSCNQTNEEPVTKADEIIYQTISPKDAKEQLDADDTILLLDVRTKEEYDSGHIVGAELLTLDVIESEAETTYTDKDQIIYVYCRSGNRSKTATKILNDLGYTNVYDLGGIMNWPYETE
ncbi:MAG: rhodanese-like domain-containing protein [Clostridiales bacterium]|nr:rhodanese-like domain-containing protein [Clostridiales bacterium]